MSIYRRVRYPSSCRGLTPLTVMDLCRDKEASVSRTAAGYWVQNRLSVAFLIILNTNRIVRGASVLTAEVIVVRFVSVTAYLW